MSNSAAVRSERRGAHALRPLCAALLLALFAGEAAAQDGKRDYSRLLFEVAEIPANDATGQAVSTGVADGAPTGTTQAGDADLNPSEPESAANVAADIAAYRARINDTLANSNPYSAALREQYDSLGALLQQAGEHEQAITAFESAMHIDRVNGGLYTLDQIPIVERMIASHAALGNRDEVNDLHGYLFYIQQKSFDDGDPRLLAAMEDWADWNVASYMEEGPRYGMQPGFNRGASLSTGPMDYVAVQNRDGSFSYVPRSQLLGLGGPLSGGSILDPTFLSTYGVDAERVIDERLQTARDYYEKIAEAQEERDADAAQGAGDTVDAETRVQHKLASVAFAAKQQLDSIETVSQDNSLYSNRVLTQRRPALPVTRGYQRNRDALEAIAEEREQDPAASPIEKAQAWISLGDWHVGYDFATRSAPAYRKAWEILTEAGMDANAIAQVFMPEPLVAAPAFAIHPYSREMYGIAADADIAWRGYMDLRLDVSRYGDVNGARIEAASEGTPQALRSELLDYLRGMKVRPAIVDGEPVKRDDVKLRYYYSY